MKRVLFRFLAIFVSLLFSSCKASQEDTVSYSSSSNTCTSASSVITTVKSTTIGSTFTLYITDPWLVNSLLQPVQPKVVYETSVVYVTSVPDSDISIVSSVVPYIDDTDEEIGEIIPVIDEDFDTTEPIDSYVYDEWDYDEYIDDNEEITVEVEDDIEDIF